jgi:hypothetical protein
MFAFVHILLEEVDFVQAKEDFENLTFMYPTKL